MCNPTIYLMPNDKFSPVHAIPPSLLHRATPTNSDNTISHGLHERNTSFD